MDIVDQVSLGYGGTSFGNMRSYRWVWGRSIPNFLRNHHIDFQSICASLYYHQQWRSLLLAPNPYQHAMSLEFLILAILTDIRWNLRVVLICISLMTKDIKNFFKCFLAIPVPLLRVLCLTPYSIFKIGLFGLLVCTFLGSLWILDISPLLAVGLVKLLCQSVGCCFVLLTVSFALQKLSVSWGPIYQFLILEPEPLEFCLGNFPPCQWVEGS